MSSHCVNLVPLLCSGVAAVVVVAVVGAGALVAVALETGAADGSITVEYASALGPYNSS